MALKHCIMGKFLGVACHCFPQDMIDRDMKNIKILSLNFAMLILLKRSTQINLSINKSERTQQVDNSPLSSEFCRIIIYCSC